MNRATLLSFPPAAARALDSMPSPVQELSASTGIPGASATTSATSESASGRRSALVSTTTGAAPLVHASANARSMRRGLKLPSSPATRNTMSRLAAMSCPSRSLPASRRASTLARGSTAWSSASPSPSGSWSATQSPMVGRDSTPGPGGEAWPGARQQGARVRLDREQPPMLAHDAARDEGQRGLRDERGECVFEGWTPAEGFKRHGWKDWRTGLPPRRAQGASSRCLQRVSWGGVPHRPARHVYPGERRRGMATGADVRAILRRRHGERPLAWWVPVETDTPHC